MKQPFTLTEFEATTALWQKVLPELTARLATLREKNDGQGQDAAATAYLRGQISMLKEIISWSNRAPAIKTTDYIVAGE